MANSDDVVNLFLAIIVTCLFILFYILFGMIGAWIFLWALGVVGVPVGEITYTKMFAVFIILCVLRSIFKNSDKSSKSKKKEE